MFFTKLNLAITKGMYKCYESHIPTHNTIIRCENLRTQKDLERINKWTNENKMLLNVKKTDYMIINFTQKQFVTDIIIDGHYLNCVT